MATQEQLEAALRKAAPLARQGDERAAAAARRFAAELKAMRGQGGSSPAQPQPQRTPQEQRALEDKLTGTSIDPTQGMSWGDSFASAYGGAVPALARGAKQMLTDAAGFVAPGYAKPLMEQESTRQRVAEDELQQLEAPLMATSGGFWGSMAGNVAPMVAVPGSAATGLGRVGLAGLEGAAFGGLQPVGTGDSRLANAAVGGGLGAGGQVVASGLGAAARGAVPYLDKASQGLARTANDAGIRLGLGQTTENPALRTMVSQLERLPFSGANSRNSANQDAFNSAVGSTFGAQGSKITPDVFSDAKDALGDEFERLTARNTLSPTPELMARLAAIRDEATRLGNSDSAKMVVGQIDELVSKVGADGQIPGRAYQSFDSQLGAKLKNGGDPALYLGKVRDAVREAMDGSIAPADRAAWQSARRKWAALKTVEPLVASSAKGDISPTSLMGRTTADKAGKARMATGRGGPLGELARVGQRFLKDAPNSGTADRLVVNLGVLGTLGAGSQQGIIDPETAAWTAAILGGNRAALKALSSKALVQGGNPALKGLARLAQPAPKLLPAAGLGMLSPTPMDIGMVSGYDRNDPRYRGD
jgi:hypothetical protein